MALLSFYLYHTIVVLVVGGGDFEYLTKSHNFHCALLFAFFLPCV
jgi:hypothetical protein